MSRGQIYFVEDLGSVTSTTSAVKIGFTTGRPIKRLHSLQSGSPNTLDLLGYIPGTQADEHRMHELLDHAHIRGEWFSLGKYPCRFLSHFFRHYGFVS